MALPTVSIFGNINRIELKYLPSGKALCTYKIECSEKNGDNWDNLWIDGVSFDKQAEFINKYFNDGDPCIAVGKLITEVYENREGKKIYTIKLKFPDIGFAPKPKGQPQEPKPQPQVKVMPKQENKLLTNEFEIDSDMIPF